jgi:hypothetical protein
MSLGELAVPDTRPTVLSKSIAVFVSILGWLALVWNTGSVIAIIAAGIAMMLIVLGIRSMDLPRRYRLPGQSGIAIGCVLLAGSFRVQIDGGIPISSLAFLATLAPIGVWIGLSQVRPEQLREVTRGLAIASGTVFALTTLAVLSAFGTGGLLETFILVTADVGVHTAAVSAVAFGIIGISLWFHATRKQGASQIGARIPGFIGVIGLLTAIVAISVGQSGYETLLSILPWPADGLLIIASKPGIARFLGAGAVVLASVAMWSRLRSWLERITALDAIDGAIATSAAIPIIVVVLALRSLVPLVGTGSIENWNIPFIGLILSNSLLWGILFLLGAALAAGTIAAGGIALMYAQRPKETTPIGIAAGLLLLSAIFAGVAGVSTPYIATGVVASVLSWTVSKQGLVLGEQLGRRAQGGRPERYSTAASLIVGGLGVGLATAGTNLENIIGALGEPSVLVIVVLGVAVLALLFVLRA